MNVAEKGALLANGLNLCSPLCAPQTTLQYRTEVLLLTVVRGRSGDARQTRGQRLNLDQFVVSTIPSIFFYGCEFAQHWNGTLRLGADFVPAGPFKNITQYIDSAPRVSRMPGPLSVFNHRIWYRRRHWQKIQLSLRHKTELPADPVYSDAPPSQILSSCALVYTYFISCSGLL